MADHATSADGLAVHAGCRAGRTGGRFAHGVGVVVAVVYWRCRRRAGVRPGKSAGSLSMKVWARSDRRRL
jgi:hypothetical protein